MDIRGKTAVVTGGAAGIGAALCVRFAKEAAAHVIVVDRAIDQAQQVASEIGGTAIQCDVSDERQIIALVDEVESRFAPIDLFCSNAGIAPLDRERGWVASSPNAEWDRSWGVNVMAHVYAARALTPRMAKRGGGYFLHTISAAGLLSQIDGAVYSTTKHAALGFAESLAITHREQGIRVSALCPQGVDTPMLNAMPDGPQKRDGVISAEAVADCVIRGLNDERFLILPHDIVAEYMQAKTRDYDRWISGMVKLRARLNEG